MKSQSIPHDCDPRIAKVHDYWNGRRPAPDKFPGRRQINPADVVALLPQVSLYEVHRNPLRFRYRLVGTGLVNTMEREVTGLWLDEAHEAFLKSDAYPDFVASAETGVLSYYRGMPSFHTDKGHAAIERILLPLAEDGVQVDMLLGVTTYRGAHRARSSEAVSAIH